jgi:hypothetical protein
VFAALVGEVAGFDYAHGFASIVWFAG